MQKLLESARYLYEVFEFMESLQEEDGEERVYFEHPQGMNESYTDAFIVGMLRPVYTHLLSQAVAYIWL